MDFIFCNPCYQRIARRLAGTGAALLLLVAASAVARPVTAAPAGPVPGGNVGGNGDSAVNLGQWTEVTPGMASWSPAGLNPGSAVQTWPGAPPCHASLQACVDATAAGDIIEIASAGPIAENIHITGKSLSLRPAEGFAPVFDGAPFLNVINVYGGAGEVDVLIEGLTVRNGTIQLYSRGAGPFTVTVRGNTVEDLDLAHNHTAIAVATLGEAPFGPMQFAIEDNSVRLDFQPGHEIGAIRVRPLHSAASGRIAGNRILGQGAGSQNPAIDIDNAEADLELDVIGNVLAGSGYNGGIHILQTAAAGQVFARIVNNLVTAGTDNNGPQFGAISLRVEDGEGSFVIVNNTIAGNQTGVAVEAAPPAAGAVFGALFNNIIADNAGPGIAIGEHVVPTHFPNGRNLVFGNAGNQFTPGPGTVTADPRFAGAGDFRLRPESPAREAGDNTRLPSDILADLVGDPRIQGPNVDIGAYETPYDVIFFDGFDGPAP